MSSPFDFDEHGYIKEPTAKDKPRKRKNGSFLIIVAAVVIFTMGFVILATVFWYLRPNSSDDAKMLSEQLKWTILINRKLAVNQEVLFWVWQDNSFTPKLEAEQRRVDKEFDDHDQKMQMKWGAKLKTLGKLNPQKGRESLIFAERIQKEIAIILNKSDAEYRQEYSTACAKLREDVLRNRPLDPADKKYNLMTESGRIQAREDDLLLAAKDANVRAQRNTDIAEGEARLKKQVAGRIASKCHDDIQKRLAILEAEFMAK